MFIAGNVKQLLLLLLLLLLLRLLLLLLLLIWPKAWGDIRVENFKSS